MAVAKRKLGRTGLQVTTSDHAKWYAYKTDQIEENGQHEMLNWFCLLGAMEALGRKPDKAVFLENWAFVSPVVLAHYHA